MQKLPRYDLTRMQYGFHLCYPHRNPCLIFLLNAAYHINMTRDILAKTSTITDRKEKNISKSL